MRVCARVLSFSCFYTTRGAEFSKFGGVSPPSPPPMNRGSNMHGGLTPKTRKSPDV